MSEKLVPITVVGIARTITPVRAVKTPKILPPTVTGAMSPNPTQHLYKRSCHANVFARPAAHAPADVIIVC